ncbi:MAG: hypothetical protein ACLVAV_01170 [Clostridium sp.]
MIHLIRTKEEYQLQVGKIRFDGPSLSQIIQNGVPSGFQNSLIALANVFVQSNINAFGKNGNGSAVAHILKSRDLYFCL